MIRKFCEYFSVSTLSTLQRAAHMHTRSLGKHWLCFVVCGDKTEWAELKKQSLNQNIRYIFLGRTIDSQKIYNGCLCVGGIVDGFMVMIQGANVLF